MLLPGLTIDELGQGRARSKLRNPILASVLRDLPGGYMERMGSGVPFMLNQMHELGFPRPTFREVGEFVLTFYKKSEAQSERNEESTASSTGSEGSIIERRYEQLLKYLHENGTITNKQYRSLTNISEATALRDLETLVERGTIRAVGKGRTRHYVL